jgi:hemolysin activation/secretion protein
MIAGGRKTMFNAKSRGGRRVAGLLATLALLFSLPAYAIERPDAGKTAGQMEERKVILPDKPAPGVVVGQDEKTAPAPAGPRIKVTAVRIAGQTVFGEAELQALVKDAAGKELTLAELEAFAGRITKHFRDAGYIVARAYLPAQTVTDGVVEIAVVAGKYGKFDIRNRSRLATDAIAGLIGGLRSGDYIKQDSLERALLLVSDTSGVSVKATLAPGQAPGTADLILDITDAAPVTGSLTADNHGNRFTGRDRGGVTVTVRNPGGVGDEAVLGGTYAGSGLDNLSLSYRHPVGRRGLSLGVAYSRTRYLLGEDFASLDASGEAKTTGIYAAYPFVRSRDFNLYGRVGYDHRKLLDRQGSTGSVTNKSANLLTFGLSGDIRDKRGDGVTGFALTYAAGRLTTDSPDDATAARTAGSYGKTTLGVSRLKHLNSRLSYYLSFTGQLADKNLDSSEKLFLGGADGVRAYPQGEAAGDEGYLFTGELRWNLPTPRFQLVAFIDNGSVTINKNPWDDSPNRRTLTGAGLGLIFTRPGDYSVRIDYAWKISADKAVSDTDKSGRFWLRGVKYF